MHCRCADYEKREKHWELNVMVYERLAQEHRTKVSSNFVREGMDTKDGICWILCKFISAETTVGDI
jgi:hypothetical protein